MCRFEVVEIPIRYLNLAKNRINLFWFVLNLIVNIMIQPTKRERIMFQSRREIQILNLCGTFILRSLNLIFSYLAVLREIAGLQIFQHHLDLLLHLFLENLSQAFDAI